MGESTTKRLSSKPAKPYPDFPLFPHATHRWAKKVLGNLHYFGPWEDPQAALDKWLDQKDDLLAGRVPRSKLAPGVSVRDVVNQFLTAKRGMVDSKELTARSFQDYYDTCGRMVEAFGKDTLVTDLRPSDFDAYRKKMAAKWGPVALGNEVQRVRSVFKYGFECGILLIPVLFGPLFRKPKRREVRLARDAAEKKLFAADEIRAMLKEARPQMKAMILLGINCGWGNTDIAMLQVRHLDLKTGFADYPRNKTGIARRAPLWEETVKAIRAAMKVRPEAKSVDDAGCVFITKYGERWKRMASVEEAGSEGKEAKLRRCEIDSVGLEFGKLLRKVTVKRGNKKVILKRHGVNFYALRHTFETIAGEEDQAACDRIMGHEDAGNMATAYREWDGGERENARLRRVTDRVHAWLYETPVVVA